MKQAVEIIRNQNGIHLFHQGVSLGEQLKSLSTIIVTFGNSTNSEYSTTEYSEFEKEQILEKAEYNLGNLLKIRAKNLKT